MSKTENFDPYACLAKWSGMAVQRDWSPQQLKSAYQKAAQSAHPDRDTGSNEAMTDVNMAWKILSDPEMRSNFDKGLGAEGLSLTHEAIRCMTDMLAPIIRTQLQPGFVDTLNIVTLLRDALHAQLQALANQRHLSRLQLDMLAKRSMRVKGPPGNFIQATIDAEIRAGLDSLKGLARAERLWNHCLEVLKDFSYDFEDPLALALASAERMNQQQLLS